MWAREDAMAYLSWLALGARRNASKRKPVLSNFPNSLLKLPNLYVHGAHFHHFRMHCGVLIGGAFYKTNIVLFVDWDFVGRRYDNRELLEQWCAGDGRLVMRSTAQMSPEWTSFA